ncbi:hypothetical protein TRVA0_037S00430 [Trichomonascus vanleenenianus]|uniref:UDP-glucose:hexose-1-phosphate uridylyltransferase n=1 Tax=Trichomonascus vanleenenianus TaxID=2268995 RepID=UPI003EC9BC97
MSAIWKEPHKRYNPLRGSWVLCSPHRTQRPWQGQQESASGEKRPAYDPQCYLCPGNTRSQGQQNPQYPETFVFVNDFSAVKPLESMGAAAQGEATASSSELMRAERVSGKCVVICFNPRHDLTLAQMSQAEIVRVVEVWKDVYRDAVANPEVKYCQIFENKGAAMGCSNPHPHGQAWMTSVVPEEPAVEHECMTKYHAQHGRGMLEDYVAQELAAHETGDDSQDRVVELNASFVAVVPFWATWPFEIMVISRRKVGSVADLTAQESQDFAEILGRVALRYDNLFETSFPYSMGLHQAFAEHSESSVEHLHVHFYPPLLRSATVKKFLVGFEMLGMPQRDLTPETAASTLRKVNIDKHYTEK